MASMWASAPGAHGRLVDGDVTFATATEKYPENWRKLVQTQSHGLIQDDTTDHAAQAREMLLMGLRIDEGIDLARYEHLAGRAMSQTKITAMADLGFVEMRGNSRLAATQSGRRLLNAVIAELAD